MASRPEWVTLAELIRPRGVRGEIISQDLSSGPDRYLELEKVWIFSASGQSKGEFRIEEAREQQDRLILKFAGIDTMDAAEDLRGCEVRIPFSQRAPLAEGEYYLSDLPGCDVLDDASGEKLGVVHSVLELPGSNLLELVSGALIPLNREICRTIDTEHHVIRIVAPEGLLDLNRK